MDLIRERLISPCLLTMLHGDGENMQEDKTRAIKDAPRHYADFKVTYIRVGVEKQTSTYRINCRWQLLYSSRTQDAGSLTEAPVLKRSSVKDANNEMSVIKKRKILLRTEELMMQNKVSLLMAHSISARFPLFDSC